METTTTTTKETAAAELEPTRASDTIPMPTERTTKMRVKLGDIIPNHFRDEKRFPIDPAKVEALRESIRATGFWPKLGRKVDAGKVELAFGLHGLTAAKGVLSLDHEVEVNVGNLDDAMMLKLLVRENRKEWQTNALIEIENVRAVVMAYAEGTIELERPDKSTPATGKRFAPSFVAGKRPGNDVLRSGGERPYTAISVARYLGWVKPNGAPQDKVHDALAVLSLEEEGFVPATVYEGLNTKEIRQVLIAANGAKEELANGFFDVLDEAKREAERTTEIRKHVERSASGCEDLDVRDARAAENVAHEKLRSAEAAKPPVDAKGRGRVADKAKKRAEQIKLRRASKKDSTRPVGKRGAAKRGPTLAIFNDRLEALLAPHTSRAAGKTFADMAKAATGEERKRFRDLAGQFAKLVAHTIKTGGR